MNPMVGIRSLLARDPRARPAPGERRGDPTTQIIVKRERRLERRRAGRHPRRRRRPASSRTCRCRAPRSSQPSPATSATPCAISTPTRTSSTPSATARSAPTAFRTTCSSSYLWGLENRGDITSPFVTELADADTDAPEAWAKSTGAGQTVAVVDSGVDLDHLGPCGAAAPRLGLRRERRRARRRERPWHSCQRDHRRGEGQRARAWSASRPTLTSSLSACWMRGLGYRQRRDPGV